MFIIIIITILGKDIYRVLDTQNIPDFPKHPLVEEGTLRVLFSLNHRH